jgi:hypothetical protein
LANDMHSLARRDGDKAAICRDRQGVKPFARHMKTFMNLALAIDLYEAAVITGGPDRLSVGTGLHGQHTALMTGKVVIAQLQRAIAKAKGRAVAKPRGTNSWGGIGQGPFLAL